MVALAVGNSFVVYSLYVVALIVGFLCRALYFGVVLGVLSS